MTSHLDRLAVIIKARTPGPWRLAYAGDGEVLKCAVFEMDHHRGSVDHRRDYTDPAPDTAFIAALGR